MNSILCYLGFAVVVFLATRLLLKNFLSNFAGGWYLFTARPFWLNERVKLKLIDDGVTIEGIVQNIVWQTVTIKTNQNACFELENRYLPKMIIENYSRTKRQQAGTHTTFRKELKVMVKRID